MLRVFHISYFTENCSQYPKFITFLSIFFPCNILIVLKKEILRAIIQLFHTNTTLFILVQVFDMFKRKGFELSVSGLRKY